MEYPITRGNPEEQTSACVIVGVYQPRELSPSAKRLDEASGGYLSQLLEMGDMEGRSKQTLLLHNVPGVPAERVLLVGCGKRDEFQDSRFRTAINHAIQTLKGTGAKQAVSCLTELELKERNRYWKIRLSVEATEDSRYRFQELKTKKDDPENQLERLSLWVASEDEIAPGEQAVREGEAIAAATHFARDLANLPGNICTPTYLADQAKALGGEHLSVTVLDEAQMEALGMGALLSVSRGSRQPAKLIVMEYRGAGKAQKPVALVGKGLTFDAGGISLKPAEAMDEMKYDMCGGASVLGALKACAELELPLNVVGIVPSSENLPDGNANKPGDIVTSMSGQTIEILNTDAEGRLILCDALTYSERFDPEVVIDVATLTGACVIALGKQASGLLSNDDTLAQEILAASRQSDDRAWQLPLWEEYQEQLDSNFADMANVGGRPAGTITAACFLSRYAKKLRWAHLDIAGTAWKTGKEKGATGRPVPLLTQFLLNRCGF